MKLKLKQPKLATRYGLYAFFSSLLIMLTVYAACGVYPFGTREIFQIDEFHQYAPFLAELRRKILSFDSLYYSWNGGMGFNFWGAIGYYAASPFNLILLFFPGPNLADAMALITIIKIAAAAFTMHYLLQRAFKRVTAITIGFGVAYSLSSFVMAYSWNIMWLDAILLLPLVALGMIKIVQRQGVLLYIGSVALLLLSNFYMGGMAGIFLALFFPYIWLRFSEKISLQKAISDIVRIIVTTITAVCISCIVVLPTMLNLAVTSASNDKFPATLSFFSTLLDHVGRMFIFAKPEVLGGLPNIYAGSIILLLLPIYAVAKKIPLRTRVCGLGLLAFILVSFNLNLLNFVWHGMHYPNSLNHRFAFTYVFLALFLSYDGLLSKPKHKRKILMPTALVLVLLALVMQFQKPLEITNLMVIGLVATVGFLLTALFMHDDGKGRSAAAASLIAILMIIEATANTSIAFWQTQQTMRFGSRDGYAIGAVPSEMQTISNHILAQPNGIIDRVAFINPLTTNDGALYNLPTVNVFCSTYPKAPVTLMGNLGYAINGVNSIAGNHSTNILDSLLGVKYTLMRPGAIRVNDTLRTQVDLDTKSVKLWQNPNSLGLGVFTETSLDAVKLEDKDQLTNQIEFAAALGVPREVYVGAGHFQLQESVELDEGTAEKAIGTAEKLSVKTKEQTFTWIPKESGTHVLTWRGEGLSFGDMWFKNGKAETHIATVDKGVANLGYIEKDIPITLRLSQKEAKTGSLYLRVARLDEDLFNKTMAAKQATALKLEQISSTSFCGTVSAVANGSLFLSIPADAGWSYFVDGKPIEAKTAFGALTSLPLTAGEHKIEARFTPKGMTIAYILSLGALLFTLYLSLWGKTYFDTLDRLRFSKADCQSGENNVLAFDTETTPIEANDTLVCEGDGDGKVAETELESNLCQVPEAHSLEDGTQVTQL